MSLNDYMQEEENEEEYDPLLNYKAEPKIILQNSVKRKSTVGHNNHFYLKRKSNLIQSIDPNILQSDSKSNIINKKEMNIQISLTKLPENHYISTIYWNISKQYLLYLFYVKWCFQVLIHKMLIDEYYYFKSNDVIFRIIYISKLIDEQKQKSIYDILHSETIHYFNDILFFYSNFSEFEKESKITQDNQKIYIHIFIFEDMNLLSNHFQSEESLKYLFENYFFYFTETIPCYKKLIIGSTWNVNALFSKSFKKYQSKLNQNHISSLLNDFYVPLYYTHLFANNLTNDFNSFGLMYFRNEKIPILINNSHQSNSVETLLTKEYFVIPHTFKDFAKKYNFQCIEWSSWQQWFYVNYILDENNIYHHWLTEMFHIKNDSQGSCEFKINNADPDIWNELSFQNVFVLEKFSSC